MHAFGLLAVAREPSGIPYTILVGIVQHAQLVITRFEKLAFEFRRGKHYRLHNAVVLYKLQYRVQLQVEVYELNKKDAIAGFFLFIKADGN